MSVVNLLYLIKIDTPGLKPQNDTQLDRDVSPRQCRSVRPLERREVAPRHLVFINSALDVVDAIQNLLHFVVPVHVPDWRREIFEDVYGIGQVDYCGPTNDYTCEEWCLSYIFFQLTVVVLVLLELSWKLLLRARAPAGCIGMARARDSEMHHSP
eukprot:SAG31_NODE_96_length_25743_cov_56.175948_4_plen_155_part_00